MKCDELGNVYVTGSHRHLGHQSFVGVPRDRQRPGGGRQHRLGRRWLEGALRLRHDVAVPHPDEGGGAKASFMRVHDAGVDRRERPSLPYPGGLEVSTSRGADGRRLAERGEGGENGRPTNGRRTGEHRRAGEDRHEPAGLPEIGGVARPGARHRWGSAAWRPPAARRARAQAHPLPRPVSRPTHSARSARPWSRRCRRTSRASTSWPRPRRWAEHLQGLQAEERPAVADRVRQFVFGQLMADRGPHEADRLLAAHVQDGGTGQGRDHDRVQQRLATQIQQIRRSSTRDATPSRPSARHRRLSTEPSSTATTTACSSSRIQGGSADALRVLDRRQLRSRSASCRPRAWRKTWARRATSSSCRASRRPRPARTSREATRPGWPSSPTSRSSAPSPAVDRLGRQDRGGAVPLDSPRTDQRLRVAVPGRPGHHEQLAAVASPLCP